MLTISKSTVAQNIADGIGGGISWQGDSSSLYATVSNTTISNNSAHDAGGGLAFTPVTAGYPSNISLQYCTIVQNTAHKGGGVYNGAPSLTRVTTMLMSSIVGQNRAADGPDVSGMLIMGMGITPNLIEQPVGMNPYHIVMFTGDIATSDINAGVSPDTILNQSGDVEPLRDNGGPLIGPPAMKAGAPPTHALPRGSRAIDVIPPGNMCGSNYLGIDYSIDELGKTRPSGNGCDLGAYEYQR